MATPLPLLSLPEAGRVGVLCRGNGTDSNFRARGTLTATRTAKLVNAPG